MNDNLELDYFSPHEFGQWWPLMSEEQLLALDAYRHLLGAPVRISPHPKAVGRRAGLNNTSKHNVDYWDKVLATDVFPDAPLDEAFRIARESRLFTGIGVYPHWQKDGKVVPGLHLDTRPDRDPRNPAMWGWYFENDRLIKSGPYDALRVWRLETNRQT